MGFLQMEKNKKNIYSTLVIFGIIFACFAGCIDDTSPDSIGVLVTIVPQAEMIEYIGGEYVDVTIMVPPGQSPHSFEPTPEQMIKVAQAIAYFKVGSGVEFEIAHMDTILEQNSDLQVFDCSEDVTVVSFDEHYGQEAHHEGDEHDHEEGDEHDHDHEGSDPHIWLSPLNFKKMAEVIYDGLVDIDPDHQNEYYSNYQSVSYTHLRAHET